MSRPAMPPAGPPHGAAARQSFASSQGRFSVDRPRIIGRRQIGSRSTAATSIWAALIQSLSMSPARHLRRLWSRLAKIGTLTCLIAPISAVLPHRSRKQVVSTGLVINSPATYRTSQGTFVALRPVSGTLTAFKITPTNPPTIATGWSVSSTGRTSPFVTSTDGTSNPIVWAYGHGTNQRLFGYNGETGAMIFAGGGANDTISGTRTFNTGIAARGRIYIAGDNKVYAFKVSSTPFALSSAVSRKTHGAAGNFDISLPGEECRSGGATNDYTLVFTFSNNLASGNASVTSGTGSVAGTPAISGNTMTVNLTGVANAQTLSVTLNGLKRSVSPRPSRYRG